MAKPEWGIKRVCQSCGARFYDMRRSPIECPKCGTVFDPDAFVKARRPRSAPAPVEVAAEEELPAADVEVIEEEVAGGEAEEEDIIEDASELGEDEDDVAEVIDNVDDKEGER